MHIGTKHWRLIQGQAVTWSVGASTATARVTLVSSPRRINIRPLTHNFLHSPILKQFLQSCHSHSLTSRTTRQSLSRPFTRLKPTFTSTSVQQNNSHSVPTILPLAAPPQHTITTMATTKEWTAQEVRDTFLKFFEERGHTFGPYQHIQNNNSSNLYIQSNLPPSYLYRTLPFSSPMPE